MSYLQQLTWRMGRLFSCLPSMPSFLLNVPLVYFAHFFFFLFFFLQLREKKETSVPPDPRLHPASSLLLPATPTRGGNVPVTSTKTNHHILVEFGLQVRSRCHFPPVTFYFGLLYFTSLYFTSRHVTSRHFTSLHFTSLHFTSRHFTSLHFASLHVTSLHFTSLHFTSLHFTSLHVTLLYFSSLDFSSLRFASLHFSSLQYISFFLSFLQCSWHKRFGIGSSSISNRWSLKLFCSQLLQTMLKHGKISSSDPDHQRMLDPFVELLTGCLKSKYNRVL